MPLPFPGEQVLVNQFLPPKGVLHPHQTVLVWARLPVNLGPLGRRFSGCGAFSEGAQWGSIEGGFLGGFRPVTKTSCVFRFSPRPTEHIGTLFCSRCRACELSLSIQVFSSLGILRRISAAVCLAANLAQNRGEVVIIVVELRILSGSGIRMSFRMLLISKAPSRTHGFFKSV